MGRDKLVLSLGGVSLLESAVNRFSAEFEDVRVSVTDTEKYPDVAARKIVDILPGAGPMSGLHAALTEASSDGVFLVAADLPFANPLVAIRIIELCGEHDACVIMLPDGELEPLFGYYKRTLLDKCSDTIKSGDYRMSKILLSAHTRFVSPDELGEIWDEKLIFNVNNPEDFDKAALVFLHS
jgi:molybdopterin-guanine dinucleotide biosynthesis protein A